MQVTFYAGFDKKLNSTKRPGALVDATTLDVVLKYDTSVETPVFVLSGDVTVITAYNYAKWGARYYYVSDCLITTNKTAELTCRLDVLATYKEFILATNAFIDRCETGYNSKLVDTVLSTELSPFFKRSLYNIWGQSTPETNWGYVSCVAVSTDQCNHTPGTAWYVFDPRGNIDGEHGGLSALTNAMMKDDDLITQLKASLGNVQSSIIKMTYIPFRNFDQLTDMPLKYVTLGDTTLNSGNYIVKARTTTQQAYNERPGLYTKYCKFDISQLVYYPVLQDWRNNAPYTRAQLYLPFYGVVEIPLSDYLDNSTISYTMDGVTYYAQDLIIKASIDFVTGDIEYTRLKLNDNQYTSYPFTVLDTYKCSCGVNIPVSQIIGSPEKFANILSGIVTGTASGAVTGFTAGGPEGALIGAAAGLALGAGKSVVSGWMTANERNLSTAGGGGGSSSTVMWRGEPLMAQLLIYGMKTNIEPETIASTQGCPFSATDLIGNHTGFVKTINASVEVPAHDTDKGMINTYLDSGIYIE